MDPQVGWAREFLKRRLLRRGAITKIHPAGLFTGRLLCIASFAVVVVGVPAVHCLGDDMRTRRSQPVPLGWTAQPTSAGWALRLIRMVAIAVVAAISVLGLTLPAAAATETTNTPSAPGNPGLPPGIKPVTPPITSEPQPAGKLSGPVRAPLSEAGASAQAKATDQPVQVSADTTETRDVVANPDGSFTSHTTLLPVRTNKNGTWVPIDPTLQRNQDGTFSPAATTEDVRFSGGGSGPMVTLVDGNDMLSLTWPTALPEPTVQGATATYPDVLPGVDLLLIADANDYRQVLVVHDAAAAANPALAAIHLTAAAQGLTVSTDAQDLLTATDASGSVIFHSATPIMWDSTKSPNVGGTPSATDPGSGHVSTLTVQTDSPVQNATRSRTAAIAAADITLTPQPGTLTGPNVTYPVFIDPQMNHGEEAWVEVTANGWHYYDQNQLAQVGDCGSWPDCSGLTVARSYFQMGTQNLASGSTTATVWSASFYGTEEHNAAGCSTPEPVAVDEAGSISSATTWPGPDGRNLGTSTSSASEGCVAGIPAVNVTSAAQDAANGHWQTLTLALRAPDETNQNEWKKFAVTATQPYSPELDVTYSYPPNRATGLTVGNQVTCNGTAYVPDGPTTLYASATDNNSPPLNPGLWFAVSNNNFASTIASSGAVRIASGTTGSWTSPGTLGPGNYQYRVSVDNNPGSSQDLWVASPTDSSFTRLATPTAVPTIGTWDYPENYWGEPGNNPGAMAFYANTASNIAGFTWTLTGAGTESAPASNQCDYNQTFSGSNGITGGYISTASAGVAVLGLPAGLSTGYHVIYVRSFDFAHNLSPESQPYVFYVGQPVGTTAGWQEAESLPHGQPTGQNVNLAAQTNCCGVSWSGGAQLYFGGTAQGQSFTVTISVPATANYELAADLTRASDYGVVAMAMDGVPLTIGGLSTFDGYNTSVTTTYDSLGSAYLTAGAHTLTVSMVGTNSASTGSRYVAGIDDIIARPTNQLDVASSGAVRATDGSQQNITPVVEPNDNNMSWKSGAQLSYPATATSQNFVLTFDTGVEADYGLALDLTRKSNYGELQFQLDDKITLGNTDKVPFDGYSVNEVTTYLPLGGAHLTAGSHTIRVTVIGKNPGSSGFQAGMDILTVTAINNVTASSFTNAMNNHGIVMDGTDSGGDLDLWGRNALSSQAMSDAGYAPGGTVTVNGATFTLPKVGSATVGDNVIADGQTIPFPVDQQIKASAVGLLAVATCGVTPETTATVTYTNGTDNSTARRDLLVPSVPDWVYGDNNTATVVAAHLDNSAAVPYSNRGAKIYAVFLPADPTMTLKSITLPYTGTGQLTNTCDTGSSQTAALHLLAIAPRPATGGTLANGAAGWLGTWSAPADAAALPPGGANFADQTIRMVVHPTTTGSSLRITLSNTGAATPATIDAATIAAQAGSTGTGATTVGAPVALTFGGNSATTTTIPAGGEVNSNAVAFPDTSTGSGNLVVSIHVPNPGVSRAPIHSTPANTTFLANSNVTNNQNGTPFGSPINGDYFLTGVDVTTTSDPELGSVGTVAVLGDQTSAAGAPGGTCGGGTSYACSWVDDLPNALGSQLPGSVVNDSRAGSPPQDWWKLNDDSGTVAADAGVGSHSATTNGGVTWSNSQAGDLAGSAVLDGTTGYLATAGPVLNTQDSFTVAAWVNIKQFTSTWQTFVTQQASNATGFSLEYDGGTNRFTFSRAETDTTNPTVDRAESNTAPQTNTWTHLVGTFDATNGTMTLYVNGHEVGSAVDNSAIGATGKLVIGRGFTNGGACNFTNGSISDVRVYQRALTALDIPELANGTSPQQPAPGAGVLSAYGIGNTSGNVSQVLPIDSDTLLNQTLLDRPNVRSVIVSLGAGDILAGESMALIKQNLTAVINANRAFGLRNLLRQDGNPIHVIATTIPPLGLASSDPREQIREQLNDDIRNNRNNYGADGLVDFDAAVTGSTPGQLNSSCVTNGMPNATYYSDLANAVSVALLGLPQTAQL